MVLHYTAMDSAAAALERLCDPHHVVSAHYLIGPCGTVWQLVDEAQRAWHAGAGSWGGQGDVNSRSIGIELANRGTHPFAAAQMNALEPLLAGILRRWDIPAEGVIAHSDMAPGRKRDPGPRFDWRRLARQGLSIWPDMAAPTGPGELWRDLATIGYPVEAQIERAAILAAFRARFRPGADGGVTDRDAAIAAALAQRWPAKLL